MEMIMSNGISLDQTIAVPVHGQEIASSFFLRAGVEEVSTGNIGAIEVPADRIQLPPASSLASSETR
jgi:hypothetical protein